MSKISVIIPCHNIEDYLPQCLDSLLAQTFKDFEVLIMENCSTDGTLTVGEKYAKADERFKVVVLDKKGVSNARNEGIKKSVSEYIAFVDGDDYVSENYLAELYKGITSADDIDISIVKYVEYYSENKIKEPGHDFTPRVVRAENGGGKIDVRPFITFHVAWASLLRKQLILENNIFFVGTYGEDTLFIYECQLLARAVSVSDKALYYYRQGRPNQATRCDQTTMMNSVFESCLRIEALFDKYGLGEDYKCLGHQLAGERLIGRKFAGTDICKFNHVKANYILENLKIIF